MYLYNCVVVQYSLNYHNVHIKFSFVGNYDLASQILSELDKNVPGLVMVNMRKISLERRKGNTAMAETLFQEYINGASQPEISSFFSIKFARYLLKVREPRLPATTAGPRS